MYARSFVTSSSVRSLTFWSRVELEVLADLLRGRLADAVDVGQTDLEALLVREVDAGDTCQFCFS